jgi:hypothetical protein
MVKIRQETAAASSVTQGKRMAVFGFHFACGPALDGPGGGAATATPAAVGHKLPRRASAQVCHSSSAMTTLATANSTGASSCHNHSLGARSSNRKVTVAMAMMPKLKAQ